MLQVNWRNNSFIYLIINKLYPLKSNAKGVITSPRPVQSCGVPRTKKAVSLPSSAGKNYSSASMPSPIILGSSGILPVVK